MRRPLPVVAFFLLVFFIAPFAARACYKIVLVQVSCDDCGNTLEVNGCLDNQSEGFTACNPFATSIPCEGSNGGCFGEVRSAQGFGSCKSDANSRTAPSITLATLVPDNHGGYDGYEVTHAWREGALRLATCSRRGRAPRHNSL